MARPAPDRRASTAAVIAARLPGEGEMARRVCAYDWAATPLGPLDAWPPSLRTAASLVLAAGPAMQIAWGPARTVLYNDACAPLLGSRHPAALGRPLAEGWPAIRGRIEELAERVFAGETVRLDDLAPAATAGDKLAEASLRFSCSPVRDEAGAVAGLLNFAAGGAAPPQAGHAQAGHPTRPTPASSSRRRNSAPWSRPARTPSTR